MSSRQHVLRARRMPGGGVASLSVHTRLSESHPAHAYPARLVHLAGSASISLYIQSLAQLILPTRPLHASYMWWGCEPLSLQTRLNASHPAHTSPACTPGRGASFSFCIQDYTHLILHIRPLHASYAWQAVFARQST